MRRRQSPPPREQTGSWPGGGWWHTADSLWRRSHVLPKVRTRTCSIRQDVLTSPPTGIGESKPTAPAGNPRRPLGGLLSVPRMPARTGNPLFLTACIYFQLLCFYRVHLSRHFSIRKKQTNKHTSCFKSSLLLFHQD